MQRETRVIKNASLVLFIDSCMKRETHVTIRDNRVAKRESRVINTRLSCTQVKS